MPGSWAAACRRWAVFRASWPRELRTLYNLDQPPPQPPLSSAPFLVGRARDLPMSLLLKTAFAHLSPRPDCLPHLCYLILHDSAPGAPSVNPSPDLTHRRPLGG